MRISAVWGFLLWSVVWASSAVLAQETPVTWKAQIIKETPLSFKVILRAQIPQGWYVYDKNSGIKEVDSIAFSLNKGLIIPESIQQSLRHQQTIKDLIFKVDKARVLTGNNEWVMRLRFTDAAQVPAQLHLSIDYQAASKQQFLPETFDIDLPLKEGVAMKPLKIPSIDLARPVAQFAVGKTSGGASEESSSAELFFLGFLGGLLALLTPCVFPMIPLTISFFSKNAATKKASIQTALFYGLSIIGIYLLLSVPFHVLDKLNPNILNTIATSPVLNVIFFLLFVVFALSFFGLYEITLPSGLGNMADGKSRTQKRIGIFFMALTLCIVSFSCTGPILGSLLAGSLSNGSGGATALTWGLLGFGVALALPFTLLAFFPQSLSALPKSGAWMNTFKVSLGFFELAFALKFLSNADLIWHWNVLKREIFIALWGILGLVYFLYLMGVVSIYGRSATISWARKIWAFLVLAFTMYLGLALPKQPLVNLSLLSGFPPPEFYSVYQRDNTCAIGLNCVKDYATALQLSKQTKKPILLDFTGWACVNCRKMEENVWAQPEVYKLIKEEFILLSLYVDDREKLPPQEQIYGYTTSDGLTLDIITVGDKWSVFETENFKNNAQPLYAVLSCDEKLLINPVGYLPDVTLYKNWLLNALSAAKTLTQCN